MSWFYQPDTMRDIDQVRLLIGDTDETDPQLQDEEITFLITTYGSITWAAVYAVEGILARYARDVDYVLGTDTQEKLSQRLEAYRQLATRLRSQATLAVLPIWGGQSISEKITDSQDSDAVQPIFTKEMETEPGTEPDGLNIYVDTPGPYYP